MDLNAVNELFSKAILPGYRIASCANNQSLYAKKLTFYEWVFGISAKEKQIIAQIIIQNKKLILQELRKKYVTNIDEQRDVLTFHQKLRALVPSDTWFRLNILNEITAHWMQHLNDKAKDQCIADLLLPGSHDSGAYEFSGAIPAGKNTWWHRIATWPIFAYFINLFAKTQTKSIEEQLIRGVRQFDFRIAAGTDGTIYLAHTFLCQPLEVELDKIKTFLEQHPEEVLVINIKYDRINEGSFTAAHREQTIHIIQKKLGNLLFKDNQLPPLKQLQRNKQQVILYSTEPSLIAQCNEMVGCQGVVHADSHELWPNTEDPEQVLPNIEQCALNNNGSYQYVYASLNTTPRLPTFVKSFITQESLISRGEKLQTKKLGAFIGFLDRPRQPGQEVTISAVMFDSCTDESMQTIISYNEKP